MMPRAFKIGMVLFAILIFIIVILFLIFNFILFVLPFILVVGLLSYLWQILNKFKKEKPKEKVLDVEYKVKEK